MWKYLEETVRFKNDLKKTLEKQKEYICSLQPSNTMLQEYYRYQGSIQAIESVINYIEESDNVNTKDRAFSR